MKKYLKWLLIFGFVLAGLIAVGYGGYKSYNYLIEDATRRIKKGVSEGITSGVGKIITSPAKIFGGGKK
jgi:hypothetical protein